MLQKLKESKSRQRGFTLVEVLIVLVIAAFIIAIVLLAVPTLQRNSRNTARKQDASRISDAVNNFVNNNNGNLPSTTATTDLTTILNDAGTLGEYKLSVGLAVAKNTLSITNTAAQAALTGADEVQIVLGAECDTSTGNNGKTIAGTARQIALQYTIETTGGYTGNCLTVE